jgi:hypothetical protein
MGERDLDMGWNPRPFDHRHNRHRYAAPHTTRVANTMGGERVHVSIDITYVTCLFEGAHVVGPVAAEEHTPLARPTHVPHHTLLHSRGAGKREIEPFEHESH